MENFLTNWEYRKYMIGHGQEVAVDNFFHAKGMFGFTPLGTQQTNPNSSGAREDHPWTPPAQLQTVQMVGSAVLGTNYPTPYLYKHTFDDYRPSGFLDSDLKRTYLWTEQMNSRMVAPIYRGPIPGPN